MDAKNKEGHGLGGGFKGNPDETWDRCEEVDEMLMVQVFGGYCLHVCCSFLWLRLVCFLHLDLLLLRNRILELDSFRSKVSAWR